jgi:hypothetical protein
MAIPCDSLPDDPGALKAIILAQQSEIARLTATEKAFDTLVQALKIRIAMLQKQKFGPSSEKIEREIEQLQLALENLEVAAAAADRSSVSEAGASEEATTRFAGNAASPGSVTTRRASACCSTLARFVPIAVARCACWARTSRRFSILSRPG